jgi:peptidoglycan/LPS O-acetylase OafA/YrhL
MPQRMRHIPQLDGLRAAAILMVFVTHAAHAPLLWAGVDLFFVLSGYLITGILLRLKQQYASGYFRPFYLRRARRILPPYFLFLIVAAAVFSIRWSAFIWCILFSANIGLAFGKISASVLTPLWSLAVEEQFYLIWPWVVLLCDTRRLKRIALFVMVASPLLRAAATPLFHTHFPIYFLSIFRADALCAGALLAIVQTQPSSWGAFSSKRSVAVFCAACALSFSSLTQVPSFHTGSNSALFNSLGYSLIAWFFCGVLLLSLMLTKGFILAALTWRPVRYLGRISYSFYLWHWAILLLLSQRIHSTSLLALSGFALTVAVASISWHFIESPLLSARSAHFETRTAALARSA